MSKSYDTVVIGSGPGGYVAGIRLGQLGVKAAVIEKESAGGVCLNVGCIPSKALIHAAKTYSKLQSTADLGITVSGDVNVDLEKMQKWKEGIVKKLTTGVKSLLKANGTDFVKGTATIVGKKGGSFEVSVKNGSKTETISAKNLVIATGSTPIQIPGFSVDQENVLDSTGGLALKKLPKTMTVIGGGYIGLELGTVYAKLGTKVTVLEASPKLLASMDQDCVGVVSRKLKKLGVEVMTSVMAKSWEKKGSKLTITAQDKAGKEVKIDAEKILLSIGRRPISKDIGLEAIGVATDQRGFIIADKQLRTNVPGVYAIGDVIGGMMLAHKASKEAEVVAEVIAGQSAGMDAQTMPAVVFTDPEIASTGMTEDEAKAAGHKKLKVGKFPFAALGRALSVNDTDGFAKVIANAENDEILGVHIVGNGASDLISEGALAIEMGSVLHDVALTIHPHPTLGESVMEAAAAALGHAVHIINK